MAPPGETVPVTTDHDDGYVLALDIGGTGIKGALIGTDRRRPRHEARRPTRRDAGPDAVVEGVLRFARELYDTGRDRWGTPPLAAGVVLPGIVDETTGTAVYAANLDWRDLPLRRLLSDALDGLDVRLGHDVRTAGLAEARLGAAAKAGSGRFFFVALGTGIACAIGTGGGMEHGAHGGAGELGHIIVRPGGARCGCGQRGCLETLASAAAVTRAWAAACGDPAATAADCARAVAAGDPAARAVWQRAVDALADGLLTGISLLDPEIVVIGGGLGEAGDTLLTPLRTALTDRAVAFHRLPELLPAALGDAAGRLGAGLLAWDAALPHAPKGPTP